MNVRFRPLPLALALVLASCANSPSPSPSVEHETQSDEQGERPPGSRPYSASFGCRGSFRIGAGFTDEQEAGIHQAATRWNVFLEREYFSITSDGGCPIVLMDLPGDLGAQMDHDHGRVGVDLAYLARFDRLHGPRFETAIMHEMGHSLGMEHVEHAVMAPDGFTLAEDFTENDRAECVRVGFCS